METLSLTVGGMSCNHCVARVSKALSALPGVKVDDVSIGSARVTYDPAVVSAAQIAGVLDAAGYPARPVVS